jgi:hypothetical protein
MPRTIQVRLEPAVVDILHQFAPNLSEAVRVMRAKLVETTPNTTPGLSDNDWEMLENLIKVTIRTSMGQSAPKTVPISTTPSKPAPFSTTKVSKGGSPREGVDTIMGKEVQWHLDANDRKVIGARPRNESPTP